MLFFIYKKYKSIFQKNRLYYFLIIIVQLHFFLIEKVLASGAYDKGTATGKGRFELSITINPFGIIPYGQNYAVLSYGLTKKVDLVGYYSSHQNGTKSKYLGAFYQFLNSEKLDLATALGLRFQSSGQIDLFAPQLLYNYNINSNYSIGGSIVNVIENDKLKRQGTALDITLYKNFNSLIGSNSKIDDIYVGIGVFKNSLKSLTNDRQYFHYSIDLIF